MSGMLESMARQIGDLMRRIARIEARSADLFSASGGGGTTLPSQSGHGGQFLETDGAALSWQAAGGGSTPTGTGWVHVTLRRPGWCCDNADLLAGGR